MIAIHTRTKIASDLVMNGDADAEENGVMNDSVTERNEMGRGGGRISQLSFPDGHL